MKTEFFRHVFENTQISNFVKMRPVGAELFHEGRTDGQTDMTKLVVAFGNSAQAPRNHIKMSMSTEASRHASIFFQSN